MAAKIAATTATLRAMKYIRGSEAFGLGMRVSMILFYLTFSGGSSFIFSAVRDLISSSSSGPINPSRSCS